MARATKQERDIAEEIIQVTTVEKISSQYWGVIRISNGQVVDKARTKTAALYLACSFEGKADDLLRKCAEL